MTEIFISAGEVSGDKHAADLMREFKRLGDFSFFGLGGLRMREAGLEDLVNSDFSVTSTVGFVESSHFLHSKLSALKLSENAILKRNVRWAILVDNQGFNMPLADKLHKAGVGVIYYLPPRVSIWGKWNAPKLSKIADLLIPFLPEDEVIYREAGAEVYFAGLPLLDSISHVPPCYEARLQLKLNLDQPVVSIFPGSRAQEIRYLTPVFAKAAAALFRERSCQIVVPISHPAYESKIKKVFAREMALDNICFPTQMPLVAMSAADVNLMASGTATLESALLKRPPVICYQISALSFWIGKMLVKSQMFGLPNLVFGKKIFPELIRGTFRVKNILREVETFLDLSEEEKQEFDCVYDEILSRLGESPVVEKVAKKILETMNGTLARH